jgi:hypothetical protein
MYLVRKIWRIEEIKRIAGSLEAWRVQQSVLPTLGDPAHCIHKHSKFNYSNKHVKRSAAIYSICKQRLQQAAHAAVTKDKIWYS